MHPQVRISLFPSASLGVVPPSSPSPSSAHPRPIDESTCSRGTIIINSTISNSISRSLSFSHACSWPLILMRHGGCRFCLFMLSDFSYFLIVLLRSSNSSISSRNTWCTVSASRGVGGRQAPGRMRLRKLLINSPSTMLHFILRVHRRRLCGLHAVCLG